ncbi:MAG: helix-turn-helix transcriptional regulator [Tumebacillaceae bacterium]
MRYLTLGQKLRLKRKDLNLTLKEVAGDKISPATLSLVERDLQVPSEDLLRYLADRMETPFSYFRETPEETLQRRAKTLLVEAEALLARKRYGMATRFVEEILNDAKELKLTHLIGQCSLLLSRVYLEQEQFSRANQHLFDAQSALLVSGHLEWMPQVYFQFGLISFRQGFYPQALDFFTQAHQSQTPALDEELGRKILSMLSQTYHKLGQYDAALRYAEQTKELVGRMDNLEAYAESLIQLGASYREKEHYDQALDLFQEAMRLIRQIDAKHELSEVEHNLASLFMKKGQYQEAHQHFETAIEQKMKLNDPAVVSTALEHIECLISFGEMETASAKLDHAMQLLDQYNAEDERARALALRFQLLHQSGKEQEGRAMLEESLTLTRQLPVRRPFADMLVRLGRICVKSGDTKTASLLFAEALAVYESLGVILEKFTLL